MIYDDMPILKSIKDYADSKALPLHMPGHKRGSIYQKLGLNFLLDNILEMDTTEVPGVDNLHCPEGAVLKAQNLAARSFGADRSFFLVNGTTSGIYAMIMASTNPGDKIIIPRNAHRSAVSATILGRLHPVYILPEADPQMGIAMGIKPDTVEKAIKDNPDAKAVLITNPTYYGACSDMVRIAKIVHDYGKILLVDEAHGSHFIFHDELPMCAMAAGADMTAQSTHKTLPAMTGSSMLHVKGDRVDLEKLSFFLQLVQTTSPSHVMLASLDAARYIMDKHGHVLLHKCIEYSNMVRYKINNETHFYCLDYDKKGHYGVYDIDPTRITICVKGGGISGSQAEILLREKFNIQLEMSDAFNIVAITTVADGEEVYNRLLETMLMLSQIEKVDYKEGLYIKPPACLPKGVIAPFEAIYKDTKMIDIKKSAGYVSAEMAVPYPPGIPVIMPGEMINQEIVDYLLQCKGMGIKVSGMVDSSISKIKIIK